MPSEEALRLFGCVAVALFFARPLSGLVLDAFKVMLRLALMGLAIQVLPFDFIDNWSKAGAGFANISATYVPMVALILLIGLSTTSLVFLSGTSFEEILKIIFYVVGGVFTAGSPEWIAFEQAIGLVVVGAFGVIIGAIRIMARPLGVNI